MHKNNLSTEIDCFKLLAHLSRRLIGELIVYEGIRLSIRLSKFSNDLSSRGAEWRSG